jgi:hypothetical protein
VRNDPEFDLSQIQSAYQIRKIIDPKTEAAMTRVVLIALISSCLIGSAMAQSCESKAVSAEGKPLHGAAKTSFVRKYKQEACEGKAISAEGKPLHGAAKNSFMAKCKKSA